MMRKNLDNIDNKRAQAGMKFLSVYGWLIFTVLILALASIVIAPGGTHSADEIGAGTFLDERGGYEFITPLGVRQAFDVGDIGDVDEDGHADVPIYFWGGSYLMGLGNESVIIKDRLEVYPFPQDNESEGGFLVCEGRPGDCTRPEPGEIIASGVITGYQFVASPACGQNCPAGTYCEGNEDGDINCYTLAQLAEEGGGGYCVDGVCPGNLTVQGDLNLFYPAEDGVEGWLFHQDSEMMGPLELKYDPFNPEAPQLDFAEFDMPVLIDNANVPSATFKGDLIVDRHPDVQGPAFSGNLDVSGTATVGEDMDVGGELNVEHDLVVSGNGIVHVQGPILLVEGAILGETLDIGERANIAGNAIIGGDATIDGGVSVNGSANISGDIAVGGRLEVGKHMAGRGSFVKLYTTNAENNWEIYNNGRNFFIKDDGTNHMGLIDNRETILYGEADVRGDLEVRGVIKSNDGNVIIRLGG